MRQRFLLLGALTAALSAASVEAQSRTSAALAFVGGAATALVAHEGGHLAANAAFGANVSFKRVEFQGIPFFAVMHSATVTPREEFVISSAGFWVQHASNEWLLTRRPRLRHEHAPFVKGAFAFNTLLSVGYAAAAFAEAGPAERDPRSMAVSLRVSEPAVGGMILAPALLDAWRYYHPGHRALAWTSRGVKVGMVLLALRPHGS
jgi:Zn-dependent protease